MAVLPVPGLRIRKFRTGIGAGRISACLVALCLPASGAAPAEEIAALRRGYQENVERALQPAKDSYRRSLAAMEARFAGQGRYAAAARVRALRLALDSGSSAPASATPAPLRLETSGDRVKIECAAKHAAGDHGVTYHPELKRLTGWEKAGAGARWKLPSAVPPGGYEVEMTWFGGTGEPGVTVRVTAGDHSLERRPGPAASPDAPVTSSLGILKIEAGDPELRLTLVPATPAPSQPDSSRSRFSLVSVRLLHVADRP